MRGGSQSSAILQFFLNNKINLDAIIFADTGLEPTYVYKQIKSWTKEPRIKKIFHKASAKNNMSAMLNSYIKGTKKSIRMYIYTYNATTNHYGTHPKTCTGSYKISPSQSLVRQLIQKKYPKKNWKDIKQEVYIGYSSDEVHRSNKMKNTSQINYKFPLIEKNMSFVNVIDFLKCNNRSTYRSACFLCPFRNDSVNGMGWVDIYQDDKKNFIKACYFDVAIRNCKNSYSHFKQYNIYLDNSCIPLWLIYKKQVKQIRIKINNKLNFIYEKKVNQKTINLFKYLKYLDKKGLSDFQNSNRRWKKDPWGIIKSCNNTLIGSCSL